MKISQQTRNFIEDSTGLKIKSIDVIQKLWSNYGLLFRAKFENGNSIIVKDIDLTPKDSHPRNWNTNSSHLRKLKSYEVEMNWYKNYDHLRDDNSYFPNLISSKNEKDHILILLEDLNSSGYPKRIQYPDLNEIKLCLSWLAAFHGKGSNTTQSDLWEIGTYWHLNTRQDEWNKMQDSLLKEKATLIDNKLNSAKYKTIIHGDAKVANFCFAEDSSKVAAVDFQYVGSGVGIKDVVYFLGSVLNESELEKYSDELIGYYFNELKEYIIKYKIEINFQELKKEWSDLYPYAIADFERFLLGWMPDHHKLNGYTKRITQGLLKQI